MIIIHAGFLDYQLWLWGEAPAENAPEAPLRRGRKASAKSRPKNQNRLPFDAGGERLLATLAEVVSDLKMGKGDVAAATVWLPAVDGQPLASSPLIAEPPPSNGKVAITPRAVAAIPLSTAEAVNLLCHC